MSLLWKKKSSLYLKNPLSSPKMTFLRCILSVWDSIKGISPFIFLQRKIKAGMTVEASIVLPLFLFFFLNLSCSIEMMRLHGNLEMALRDVGNRVSVYGIVLDSVEGEQSLWKDKLTGLVISYGYVQGQVTKYVGEEYLEESPLTDGAQGLAFLESSLREKDCFELILTYQVSPWMELIGFKPFRMANRYYGHFWTGYEIPGSEQSQETVYVTENGSVYHEDRECSHLRISIQEVPLQEVGNYRNEVGGKYSSCEKCGKKPTMGNVYITEDGTRYHCDRECSALKRTVYAILRTETKGYRPCKTCACGA